MNPLAARFTDVPSLVTPKMPERFQAALRVVAAHPRAGELLAGYAANDDDFWYAADDWRAVLRPYVVRDGILHIPVKGILLHDFPWAFGSWATGYLYIARALARGLADMNVVAIALVCDSYGGELAGCFELVDKIYAARSIKPIRAFSHEFAFSAGYAVASAASKIIVSRTGGVGSIGIVTSHFDVSRAMEDAGYKITFIFSGAHKVDGNSYEPLPADVKARIQQLCDEPYALFCEIVARNRGLDVKAVRATEAECFTAGEAVENGLADAIGPFDEAVAAFNADLSAADEEGEDGMSNPNNAAGPAASAAAIEAAQAAGRTEGETAGKAAGAKEGKEAERQRVAAILGCDEAKGRDKLAQHLAFKTDMSADDAKAMLAAAPKEAAAAPALPDALTAAMASVKNPQVGVDTSADASGGDDAAKATAAVKAYLGDRARAA